MELKRFEFLFNEILVLVQCYMPGRIKSFLRIFVACGLADSVTWPALTVVERIVQTGRARNLKYFFRRKTEPKASVKLIGTETLTCQWNSRAWLFHLLMWRELELYCVRQTSKWQSRNITLTRSLLCFALMCINRKTYFCKRGREGST